MTNDSLTEPLCLPPVFSQSSFDVERISDYPSQMPLFSSFGKWNYGRRGRRAPIHVHEVGKGTQKTTGRGILGVYANRSTVLAVVLGVPWLLRIT